MPDGAVRVLVAVSDSIELSIIAKATVVLGLALLAVRGFRHTRASVRHVVLASTFGVLVVLPAVVRVVPPVAVPVPVTSESAPIPRRLFVVDGAATNRLPPVFDVAPAPGRTPPVWMATLLRSVWIGIAALFVLPVAVVLWRLHQLRRGSVPWPRGESLL